MRYWISMLALPLVLAQAHARRIKAPRGTPDAGVGGIAIHVAPDGGEPDAGPAGGQELARLRQELDQLQARTAGLEREVVRTRHQEQLLQQLGDQVAALRRELGQQRRQEANAQAQAQQARDDAQQAISGLMAVQNTLAGGNLDVDAALADARDALPPQAQRDLDAARDALRNRDAYGARTLIAQAIADAQAGR